MTTRYRIIVEFEFGVRDGDHFAPRIYMRYSYVRLRFTSKAGVKFLVSPTREEQTVVAMSACAREQTIDAFTIDG